MSEIWKKEESEFMAKFGEGMQKKKLTERSSFEGRFFRSPIDDQINALFGSDKEKMLKYVATTSVCILLICVYSCTIIGIVFLE